MRSRFDYLTELFDDIWHQCGYQKRMTFWEMVNTFCNDPNDEHHKEAIEFRDLHNKTLDDVRAALQRGYFLA